MIPTLFSALFARRGGGIWRADAGARPGNEPVRDLPLVEVPVAATADGTRFAVLLTGDGGWAELDRRIADGIAAHGVPVVGWNSLNYYWAQRSPEEAAADLERILRHYTARWGRERVLLIGFSFGADALPFLINRLPPDLVERVDGVALLALAKDAVFRFYPPGWLGAQFGRKYPTSPEVRKITRPLLCINGKEEEDRGCVRVGGRKKRVALLPGGHHFGRDYDRVVNLILRMVQAE